MNELEKVFARRRASAPVVETPAKSGENTQLEEPSELTAALAKLGDPNLAKKDTPPADISDAAAPTASFASPAAAFDQLVSAQSIADTQAAYTYIYKALGFEKPPTVTKLSEALLPQLGHRFL